MKKICFVVSEPMTAQVFLRDHIRELARLYEVTLVANFSDGRSAGELHEYARVVSVPIVRKINIFADMRALFCLFFVFLRGEFVAVHSVTPKAGLLAMVAGFFAGIPFRVHTFTGQVWANKFGVARHLLRSLDKLTYGCATFVLVDSESQRRFLIENRVITAVHSGVLGEGSICGVDTARFKPGAESRRALRVELGVPEEAFIFLFLGRVNRDKGVADLVRAFSSLEYAGCSAYLLIVGPEEDDVLESCRGVLQALGTHIVRRNYTSSPELYMAAVDVFCLPSYREGFGSVILEAAASGVPSIASRIYGITDAVEDGVTGLLHAAGDSSELSSKMDLLLRDSARCQELGMAAYHRAISRFSVQRVVGEMVDFYRQRI